MVASLVWHFLYEHMKHKYELVHNFSCIYSRVQKKLTYRNKIYICNYGVATAKLQLRIVITYTL